MSSGHQEKEVKKQASRRQDLREMELRERWTTAIGTGHVFKRIYHP